MAANIPNELEITYSPVTKENVGDFQELMKRKGCWCMYWRLPGPEFAARSHEERKNDMRGIILSGTTPGIIAHHKSTPIGWCSVGPRDSFSRLSTSWFSGTAELEDVWSIVCFYISPRYRRKGLTSGLLRESVRFAKENGAKIIEAYPLDIEGTYPYTSAAFTGFLQTFINAGFVEVDRHSSKRPVVRYFVGAVSK